MLKPPGKSTTLTQNEICRQLDIWLETEFTFFNTEQAGIIIADLPRPEQDFILQRVKSVASTNITLAYEFITRAVDALDRLDRDTIEAWSLHAMDMYDKSGLHAALEVIKNFETFLQQRRERVSGTALEDVQSVLSHFAHGLSGRQLKLEEAEDAYTDTETIYLPRLLVEFQGKDDNFQLYKSMIAYCWAQNRFGSFRVDLLTAMQESGQAQAFLDLYHALDTLRLEGCIARELPGLYRHMQSFRQADGDEDTRWSALREQLSQPHATAHDVLRLTQENLGGLTLPVIAPYQGSLHPDKVHACLQARMEKEKARLRVTLRDIQNELGEKEKTDEAAENNEKRFGKRAVVDESQPDGVRVEITLNDQPIAPPEHVKSLITSIMQDIGDIPDDYLVPAGEGEYDPTLLHERTLDPEDVWKGTYHEEGAFLYNEWDFRRQHYRKNWCAVRETEVKPVHDDFVRKTLSKYSGLLKHLHKTFEAMRDEDRLLKRQVHGDGVDIDALVEALADARDGSEMTDRLFLRMHRTERNIAVCFMVDMSGSTKGWINDAERESLLLLAETLETLGDRYAIYGFSGMARKRCEIYRIKKFDEPYDEAVRARITGIQPKDYTRMGFAIRHLSKLLNDVDAKTRILITLSDGKPDDYDNYRGEYGIEDTRRALIESRRSGIHPYCITIDREARDYLPHMYGPAGFTVIDEVTKLPMKVSDIYRRLTT